VDEYLNRTMSTPRTKAGKRGGGKLWNSKLKNIYGIVDDDGGEEPLFAVAAGEKTVAGGETAPRDEDGRDEAAREGGGNNDGKIDYNVYLKLSVSWAKFR
jgi:hypothetical protein